MLFPVHRAGQAAADCSWLPRVTPAAFSAIALVLATPLAAHAQQTTPPDKVFGDRQLSDEADNIAHDSQLDLTNSVDFGGGNDLVTNTGTITIGANATAPVQVTLLGLEALKNDNLIDLRNGRVGDVLTLSDDYNGAAKARLGLDVGPGGADRLVVGDVANGKTAVVLAGLSAKTATITGDKGPVLIQAGAGSTKDAFSIENPEFGYIRYTLVQDTGASGVTYRLKGQAGQRAYEMLKVSESVRDVWRQSADAWSGHVASLRDAGDDASGAGVWGQAFGGRMERDDKVGTVAIDYQQTTYGGQMGFDLINAGMDDRRILLGLTGGYVDARQQFSGLAGQEAKLQVANFGGYAALTHGGFFVNALAKVDRQSIKVTNGPDAIKTDFDGTAYGAQLEAGLRSAADGVAYEQLLSVNYVSARLDDANVFSQTLTFDNATGFVAKLGVRGSVQSEALGGVFTTYGAAFVGHDFTIKNGVTLVSSDQSEHLSKDGGRTFGQLAAGLSYRAAGAVVTFVEGSGESGGGRSGGALRLGVRVGF